LLLGILAAGAISEFTRRITDYSAHRVPPRPSGALRLAMVLPLLLVLAEGRSASPHPTVPVAPAVMRTAEAPLLVLPSDFYIDENVMLWGTDRFPAMVNGGSGFEPRQQHQVRRDAVHFPDAASVDLLRRLGVKTVIVLKDQVAGTPYAGAVTADPVGLDITREEDATTVVFRL
jgi:hypothetical protein